MRRCFVAMLLAPLFSIGAQSTQAKPQTGRVSGRVQDPWTRTALAGAKVAIAASRNAADSRVGFADSTGAFVFDELRPGWYDLAAQLQRPDSTRSPLLFARVKVSAGRKATVLIGEHRPENSAGDPCRADSHPARAFVSGEPGRTVGQGAAEIVPLQSGGGDRAYALVDKCRPAPASEKIPPG